MQVGPQQLQPSVTYFRSVQRIGNNNNRKHIGAYNEQLPSVSTATWVHDRTIHYHTLTIEAVNI